MILLASEHKREIEPLLESYTFEKQGKLLKYKNLYLFINYGRGALSLGFEVSSILSSDSSINIAVLFGFSGSLDEDELKVGDFFLTKNVKLLCSKKPLFNPIELITLNGIRQADVVSLFDGYEFDNRFLNMFGDAVDKESYMFAKALKGFNVLGMDLRLVSDTNTKSEILNIKKKPIVYNVDFLKSFLDKLMRIDRNELNLEIVKHTGYFDLGIVEGIRQFVLKNRMTFSNRQKMYKKIKVNTKKTTKKPFRNTNVLIENGVKKSRISIDADRYNVYKIDDYVSYFHNLKDKKAVLFANKKGEFLRKTPNNYTPDKESGYSIVNAYNCIYDCEYCFLKGYFRSFNPVIFLNYEYYFKAILKTIEEDKRRPIYFYGGTFSDSLAINRFSDFNKKLIEFFGELDSGVYLELRTKSDDISMFYDIKPNENTILAFSINPQVVIDRYEHLTPSLRRRYDAMRKLDNLGFKIGIRIDPVFIEYIDEYKKLAEIIKNIDNLHSVEIGFLRFNKKDYANMLNKEPSILRNLIFDNGMYRYDSIRRKEAIDKLKQWFGDFYINME
jgi:spore photoproduct lyase